MGRSQIRKGKFQTKDGYIKVYLESSNPFHSMAESNSHVYEHRLVMAKHLGRCLLINEQVHHKNGVRNDNRLENLELASNLSKHSLIHVNRVKELESRVKILEEYIAKLEKANPIK